MPKIKDIFNGYEVIKRITKAVYLVRKLTSSEKFILKIVEKDPNQILNDEVKIGMSLGLKCPHLVEIIEVFDEDDDFNMIMEYCENGDLLNRIRNKGKPDEGEICRFVYESGIAIKTLHESNIIHRRIKGSNFFLTKNGGFKLGDYSVSCVMDPSSSKTMTHVGSEGYISPEIMNGERKYTNKVDIYSWGVTLIEFILGGRHPFSNENGIFNASLAMTDQPISLVTQHPSPFILLALQMIALNPTSRPTAADVCRYPFLFSLYTVLLNNMAVREEAVAIQVEYEGMKREKESEEGRNKEMEEENERLRQRNKEVREKMAILKAENASIQRDIVTLKGGNKMIELENGVFASESDSGMVEQEYKKLWMENKNLATEKDRKRVKILALKRENSTFEEKIALTEKKTNVLRGENSAMRQKTEALRMENFVLKKEKERVEEEERAKGKKEKEEEEERKNKEEEESEFRGKDMMGNKIVSSYSSPSRSSLSVPSSPSSLSSSSSSHFTSSSSSSSPFGSIVSGFSFANKAVSSSSSPSSLSSSPPPLFTSSSSSPPLSTSSSFSPPSSSYVSSLSKLKGKVSNLSLRFVSNVLIGPAFVKNTGSRLKWNSSGAATFFVDPEIVSGIYKIAVEIKGDEFIGLYFGLAATSLMSQLTDSWLGSVSGSCGVNFNGIRSGGDWIVWEEVFPSEGTVNVALELDANDPHRLSLFVEGKQIPHCVGNVPERVHFGISGRYSPLSVELKYFARLITPTAHPYDVHSWK